MVVAFLNYRIGQQQIQFCGRSLQMRGTGGLAMDRRITIDRAVEILREEYKKACENPVVRNPVAYALYQTWKRFDNG